MDIDNNLGMSSYWRVRFVGIVRDWIGVSGSEVLNAVDLFY